MRNFDPLMIPRVGFHEERANKKGIRPARRKENFVRAQGLAGIHPARISADQALQAAARAHSLKMVPTIH
jgi:hypothetical protein